VRGEKGMVMPHLTPQHTHACQVHVKTAYLLNHLCCLSPWASEMWRAGGRCISHNMPAGTIPNRVVAVAGPPPTCCPLLLPLPPGLVSPPAPCPPPVGRPPPRAPPHCAGGGRG
jgi:hypothetical protein